MSKLDQLSFAQHALRKYGHYAGVRHCAKKGISIEIALSVFAGA